MRSFEIVTEIFNGLFVSGSPKGWSNTFKTYKLSAKSSEVTK